MRPNRLHHSLVHHVYKKYILKLRSYTLTDVAVPDGPDADALPEVPDVAAPQTLLGTGLPHRNGLDASTVVGVSLILLVLDVFAATWCALTPPLLDEVNSLRAVLTSSIKLPPFWPTNLVCADRGPVHH